MSTAKCSVVIRYPAAWWLRLATPAGFRLTKLAQIVSSEIVAGANVPKHLESSLRQLIESKIEWQIVSTRPGAAKSFSAKFSLALGRTAAAGKGIEALEKLTLPIAGKVDVYSDRKGVTIGIAFE